MPKNILVFSDGTGQEGGVGNDTNIYKIFKMVEDRTSNQIAFYDRGVGTGWRKVTGNIGGMGISRNIQECYRFIFGEYSPKDRQKGVLVAVEQVRGREGDPELDGIVDHLCLFRDDLGAAGHASEVMAGVAVIVLNGDRSGFADDMPLRRQMLGESIPAVGVEDTVGQVLDLVVEPSKRCSITTADHPGNRSPCATIHRLDDPEFVFFEPMKCHISSNSISLISPGTSGSGSFAISSTLHR